MIKSPTFFKNKYFWIWLAAASIVIALYIKGALIEKETGVRLNYPLAFAEVLSVAFWGLSYKLTSAWISARFSKAGKFLSKRPAIVYLTGFIFCLLIAAFLSFTGLSFFVKQFANIAFFMLVWAIVIDFVDLLKDRRPE